MANTNNDEKELEIIRIFDAPQPILFQMWIDPKQLARWWGPKGFTNPVCDIDARPNGHIRIDMRGPDGTVYPMTGTYQKIMPFKSIIFMSTALDDKGKRLFDVRNTIGFEEHDGKTKLTMHAIVERVIPEAAQYLKGMDQGWNQSLDKLDEVLKSSVLTISRTFDTPLKNVWKALSEPESLKQWWGPKGFTMDAMKLDFRPDGMFHYKMLSPDNKEMWGRFVYKETLAHNRIVFVNSFSDKNAKVTRAPMSKTWPLEVFNTLTLSEQGNKTRIILQGFPINATEEELKTFKDGRESMQKGFEGTWEQLDDYLEQISA